MSDELKPCPFCGGADIGIQVSAGKQSYAACNDCAAFGPSGNGEDGAVAAWNRRTLSGQSGAANDTADDNPPLTLKELRNLAGKEAVYAVSSADKGHWCVIDTAPRFGGGTAIIAIYGRGLTLGGDDYGTLWLAYRRKPEED